MHSGSNEQWSASRCTTTHTVKQRIHQNYSHLCQYIVTLLLCYDLWLITRWFYILDTKVFDSLDGKKITLVQKSQHILYQYLGYPLIFILSMFSTQYSRIYFGIIKFSILAVSKQTLQACIYLNFREAKAVYLSLDSYFIPCLKYNALRVYKRCRLKFII